MNRKCSVLAALAGAGLAFGAGPALAYIGPGAGLSLLGALWGVVAAVAAALLFLLIWPLRRLMRRQRAATQRTATQRMATRRTAAQRPTQQPQGSSPARGR
jgi:membrane protein implicated in regulation of membrane protease activity